MILHIYRLLVWSMGLSCKKLPLLLMRIYIHPYKRFDIIEKYLGPVNRKEILYGLKRLVTYE